MCSAIRLNLRLIILQFIYSKIWKPSASIEQWVLRQLAYDFNVVYRPSKINIADALSGLNGNFSNSKTGQDVFDFVHALCVNSTPTTLSTREIERLLGADPEFDGLGHCIMSGDWSKCTMHSYLHVKYELSCYVQLILQGTRLVISLCLRECVLNLAHEGH